MKLRITMPAASRCQSRSNVESLQARWLLAAPVVSSFSISPNPQYVGQAITLQVAASDVNRDLEEVNLFRESDGVPGLNTNTDTLLAITGATASVPLATTGFPAGSYTYYAIAYDAAGNTSNVASVTHTLIDNHAPTIGGFTASPDPSGNVETLTLTATNVQDPEGNAAVARFYRESNGVAGLQAGSDVELASDSDGSNGYSAQISSDSIPFGTITLYVAVTDTLGATGDRSTTVQRIDALRPAIESFPDYLNVSAGSKVNLRIVPDVVWEDAQVTFVYRESDGIAGLNRTTDQLVGQAKLTFQSQVYYALTMDTAGLPVGAYTLYAVTEIRGVGSMDASTLTIVNAAPTLASLSASPESVTIGAALTLTAAGVSDANGNLRDVRFYHETNNVDGYQAADALLGIDANGADGYAVTISTAGFPIGSNRFYAFATDSDNATSAGVAAFSTVVRPLSAAPGTPDLVAASDTGSSSTDDRTLLNNSTPAKALGFTIPNVIPGAMITLFADGTAIGSIIASGTTATVTTSGTLALGDGNHVFSVTQAEPEKLPTPAAATVAVWIDTTAPSVLLNSFEFATRQAVAFQFTESLAALPSPSGVTLRHLTLPIVAFPSSVTGSAANTIATLPISPILSDGDYRATLAAALVVDVAGNTMAADRSFDFFVLSGDANRDRSVGFADLVILAQNYNQPGRGFGQGNFNYSADGKVDFSDLVILAQRYGATLGPATLKAAATLNAAATSPSKRTRAASPSLAELA